MPTRRKGAGGREVNDILDLAIRKEEEARAFYLDLSVMAEEEEARATFRSLASEEQRHREYLAKSLTR